MKYKNISGFEHGLPQKVGVLLTNLGTPNAPTRKALRPYLKQFLSDPRVIEVPRLLWWCILNLVILNLRPAKSARAYQSIWTERGSPLEYHTRDQAHALQAVLAQKYGPNVIVDWAMRYGSPAIDDKIQALMDRGVRKLVVLPLYPQYSAATSASTFDAVAQDFRRRRWLPELRFVTSYHDYPPYIEALAQTIEMHWQSNGRAEKMVFSYHGIPLRYLHAGDPYHCQCHTTSRLLAERLQLTSDQYLTTFQSRVGREQWLRPYTDETLLRLPQQGVRSIQVVCPGFAADCLETIEEIEVENRNYFLQAGGEKFDYIPALNSQEVHIEALRSLVEAQLQGWRLDAAKPEIRAQQKQRAEAHPYNQMS